MKQTVYNKKTGKPATVEGVDAREYLESGGWTTVNPKDADQEAKDKAKKK